MAGNAAVIAEARQAHTVDPRLVTRQGVKIVVYSRTRVYLDRDAWEMLPADGVFLMQVRPTDGGTYSLAFTAAELAAVFGEVRNTRSWDRVRCYHFPKPSVCDLRVSLSDVDWPWPRRRATGHRPKRHRSIR